MCSSSMPLPSMETQCDRAQRQLLERKTNVIDALPLPSMTFQMLDLNANHLDPKPGMLDRERNSIGVG